MKNFREIVETPVGMVGRTSKKEAEDHISPDLEKKFAKIVQSLGGKTVARKLLANMDPIGNIYESNQTPEDYLRDLGYKIKYEEPTKKGKELDFFTTKAANNAYEDLQISDILNKFDIKIDGKTISYIAI